MFSIIVERKAERTKTSFKWGPFFRLRLHIYHIPISSLRMVRKTVYTRIHPVAIYIVPIEANTVQKFV